MRLLVQRVKQAEVFVEGSVVGSIDTGLLVLLGIHTSDTEKVIPFLVDKLKNIRLFSDVEGKMNLSLSEVGGSILVVSQFTLYGACDQGRRPSFIHSAKAERARPLYENFVSALEHSLQGSAGRVATGRFGAHMEVKLINDGPVTLLIEQMG